MNIDKNVVHLSGVVVKPSREYVSDGKVWTKFLLNHEVENEACCIWVEAEGRTQNIANGRWVGVSGILRSTKAGMRVVARQLVDLEKLKALVEMEEGKTITEEDLNGVYN